MAVVRLVSSWILVLVALGCSAPLPSPDRGGGEGLPEGTSGTTSTPRVQVPASGSGVTDVVIVATEFEFTPPDVKLRAGEQVRVTLQNRGNETHVWTIKEFGAPIAITGNPGRSPNTVFVPFARGTFRIVCTQPGHADLGMVGEIIVD